MNLQNFPRVSDFYETHACSMMTDDNATFIPYMAIVLVFIGIASLIGIVLCGAVISGMHKMRGHMSAKTYRMHKQLIISISLQVSLLTNNLLNYFQCVIPLTFIAVPYIFLALAPFYQWSASQRNFL